MQEIDDHTVVAAASTARNDFARFIEPYWPDMIRLARRLAPGGEWEDVVQDALATAWRKWSQFDEARGTPRNWLLAVVADHARRYHRRMWRGRVLAFEDRAVDDVYADVDLDRALHTLTTRQRTAVELHYYLGLPLADVAEVMACSTGTVKSTLSVARTRLRSALGEDE